MKTVASLALAALISLPLTAFAAPPGPSQAPLQAPKAAQAPAQAPIQAPMKTAQAAGGYRTYSYQPATGYSYGGYPNGGYRTRAAGHSYQNATNKTLGRVN